MKHTGNQKGFTLIEVLVALTILSVAAMGLMTVSGQSLRQSQYLEDKTLALIAAQNRLAQLHAAHTWQPQGSHPETVLMAGREWRLTINVQSTPREDMEKIDVAVFGPDAGNASALVTLTGYIGRH